MENIILYDWLSFTVKTEDYLWVIHDVLGLGKCPWEPTKGARGYRDRQYFNCIRVHYNGREDMGVWVELSGQGCRAFEELTDLPEKWETLFKTIADEHMHITRLDVAYDDHKGTLDIDQIIQDSRNKEYVSKTDYWEIIESSKGQSLQFGSPKSDLLIRIYDKARERNCPEGQHWIRAELQLRNDRAIAFTKLPGTIGESYSGVVMNYLRFVEENELDTNRWRWPLKGYWRRFLDDADRIKIYQSPGTDYNLDKLNNVVINQFGNATAAYIEIHGVDVFLDKLENRPQRPNPKYDRLVKAHDTIKGKKEKPIKPPPVCGPIATNMGNEADRIKQIFDENSEDYTIDRFKRRWVKCMSCEKIKEDRDFFFIGGKYGPNRGLCSMCEAWGEYSL